MTQQLAQLTAEAILKAQDITIEKMVVEQWKGEIYVRELLGDELAQFTTMFTNSAPEGKGNGASERVTLPIMDVATVCGWGICDKTGQSLFTTAEQIDKLAKKNIKALTAIFIRILNVSGLGAEAIDAAEKNS